MPGFRVKWNYTGIDFKPDPLLEYPVANYKEYTFDTKTTKNNKEFIRKGNLSCSESMLNVKRQNLKTRP